MTLCFHCTDGPIRAGGEADPLLVPVQDKAPERHESGSCFRTLRGRQIEGTKSYVTRIDGDAGPNLLCWIEQLRDVEHWYC